MWWFRVYEVFTIIFNFWKKGFTLGGSQFGQKLYTKNWKRTYTNIWFLIGVLHQIPVARSRILEDPADSTPCPRTSDPAIGHGVLPLGIFKIPHELWGIRVKVTSQKAEFYLQINTLGRGKWWWQQVHQNYKNKQGWIYLDVAMRVTNFTIQQLLWNILSFSYSPCGIWASTF